MGRDGAGNILGELSGLVRGGSGTGRGLWIDGGANNVFTSSGSISAVSNLAIQASTGNDAVINTGLVVGNIDLGSGTNSFDNRAGSTFIAINTINLRDPAPVIQSPLVMQSAPRAQRVTESATAAPQLQLSPGTAPANDAAAAPARSQPLISLDQAMADLDRVAEPSAQTMVNLDQAMSGLSRLMAPPVPARDGVEVTILPQLPRAAAPEPVAPAGAIDAPQAQSLDAGPGATGPVPDVTAPVTGRLAMLSGGAINAPQSGSVDLADHAAPDGMIVVNEAQSALPIDEVVNAGQPDAILIAATPTPDVMSEIDPDQPVVSSDLAADAEEPESLAVGDGKTPDVMAVLDPVQPAMPVDGGILAAQPDGPDFGDRHDAVLMAVTGPAAAPNPGPAAPGIGAATFSNSGDFQMGLSASRLPIDLLNGAEFGNFDAIGDPQTNILYGVRVINTVALDGHFEQTAAGHLAFDVAFGPYASDRVDVTGTATMAGTGDVILTWLETDAPVTLFATAGGGFDNGLEITDTLAVDFSINADAAGVHLLIDTDFGLPSLNRNGRALGGHMDSAIQAGGSAGIGRLMAFLGNMQQSELELYEAVFAELNPEPHLAALQGQLASANAMSGDLFNCGSVVSSADDQCVWSRLEQSSRDRTSSFENLGVDSGSPRFSGGFQQPLGHDWSVALAIAYEQINETLIDGGRAKSDGQGFTAGIGLERHNADGHYYGASVSGGWSWLETARSVSVFEPGLGLSEPQTGHVRLDAHVGNVFRTGSVFANPSVGLGLTALRHDGLRETGLDGLGVQVIRDTQLIASLNPVLRVGHVFHEGETGQGTVSLTMGARVSSRDRMVLPIRFTGANPAADPAIIGTVLDQVVYQLGADFNIVGNDRISVNFGYGAEFGEETENHRAGFELRMRF